MTKRLLPLLVTFVVCAVPATALAQTSDYNDTPTLSTSSTTTPTTPPKTSTTDVAPTSTTGDTEVKGDEANGGVAPATSNGSTGTSPSSLAYTGSEVWLVALIGLFAVVGGAALLRPGRRVS